ncbi:MAG: MFS transporter [Candidatus Paracaedibacteraceae bacterium]|nr:MFS transporter [Candidatus Paracaedibacteraceae bacterium]
MQRILTLLKKPQSRLAIFGTALEYYDYTLYGFCAGLLAQHLFPSLANESALLYTYLLFCAGSIAKPLGALIFGWLGDLYGRRLALRLSMLGIVLPTLIITALPSGLDSTLAMIIVLFARVLQGIFIAGESDGVRIRLYESNPTYYPFVKNVIVSLSCYIGIFLASQGAFIAKQFPNYWRLPFLWGGILGLLLLKARRHLTESPHFQRAETFWIKPDYRGLLSVIMICGAVGGTYHLFFVYQPTYWTSILSIMTAGQAQSLISLCLGLYCPGLLIAAFLSERYKGEVVFISGTLLVFLLTPFLWLIPSPNLLLLCSLSLCLSLMHAPGYVLLMQQFPMVSRYRHMSVGHSLGSLLMSGTAPLIATYCWQKWHTPFSLVYHLMILMGIGVLGMIIGPMSKPTRDYK